MILNLLLELSFCPSASQVDWVVISTAPVCSSWPPDPRRGPDGRSGVNHGTSPSYFRDASYQISPKNAFRFTGQKHTEKSGYMPFPYVALALLTQRFAQSSLYGPVV